MRAYSKEMRRDVLNACDANQETGAVALRFKVSESWVRRVKQERRELGKTAPCTTRRRTPKWARHAEQIQRLYARQPDLTLWELKAALQTDLCCQTLCNALHALKLTLKKSPQSGRTRSARRRRATRRLASSTSGARSRATGVHR